jgi:hypothetical protein
MPPEVIVPKSAVGAALAILAPTNAKPATKAPKQYTTSFIRLSRVGGGMENMVTDGANLLVECFAPDGVQAETLANHARALFAASVTGVFAGAYIRWWEETSGPVDFHDPDTEWSRYQFTGRLSVSTQ